MLGNAPYATRLRMPGGPDFAEAARRAFGSRPQRDIAAAAGCSQATIHNMFRGMAPSRRMLAQIVGRTRVSDERAAALFAAAGYAGPPDGEGEPVSAPRPDPTYEPDLDPLDVKQFKGAEQLPPGDIEEINAVVRALVKEKLRRQGIE